MSESDEWTRLCDATKPLLKTVGVGPHNYKCVLLTPDFVDAPQFADVITERECMQSLIVPWPTDSKSLFVSLSKGGHVSLATKVALCCDVECRVTFVLKPGDHVAQEWHLKAKKPITTSCCIPIGIATPHMTMGFLVEPVDDCDEDTTFCFSLMGVKIGPKDSKQEPLFVRLFGDNVLTLPTCMGILGRVGEGFLYNMQDMLEPIVKEKLENNDTGTANEIKKWCPSRRSPFEFEIHLHSDVLEND